MKNWRRLANFSILFVLLVGSMSTWAKNVVLRNITSVYAKPANSISTRLAIGNLRKAFKKLYGHDLTVLTKPPTDRQSAIVLGEAALDLELITREELSKAGPNGFALKCVNGKIAIAGASPGAIRHGVAELLERLGVRGIGRNAEFDYPGKPIAVLSDLTFVDHPFFDYRNCRRFMRRGTVSEFADCRQAANQEYLNERGLKSDLWRDHSAGYLLPKCLYYDEHPEYYSALDGGERVAKDQFTDHRTPLCLSNPDVQEITKRRLLQWMELQPERRFFPVTYGDTAFWCQCSDCLALDEKPNQYAARLLRWINPICEEAARRFPDKAIFTFAYGGTDHLPKSVKPHEKLRIVASTGLGGVRFYDHEKRLETDGYRNNWKKLTPWIKACAARPLVCEYMSGVYLPAPVEQTTARYRDYAARGIGGIMFSYGHPRNFTNLWHFLHSKLMWDPDDDETASRDEFIDRYYDAAATAMKRYFNLVRAQYHHTLENGDELIDGYPKSFYETPFVDRALACFREAEAALRNDPAKRDEIKREETLFLEDMLIHSTRGELDHQRRTRLKTVFDRIFQLRAPRTDKEKVQFARDLYKLAVRIDANCPGALGFAREYVERAGIKASGPEIKSDRIIFRPDNFLEGFGPLLLRGTITPCPPKMATLVYVKDNSMRRPSRTYSDFTLEAIPKHDSVILELWGQDCDHDTKPAKMRVVLNGQELYEGPVSFVKHNWSQMKMEVPKGTLRRGRNTLEIINAGDPSSVEKWFERWFAISEVTIRFNPKQRTPRSNSR